MSALIFSARVASPPQTRHTNPATPKQASVWAAPQGLGPKAFPLSHAEKLSARQAARRLGVTLSTVYRLIETEVLEASKVGGRWVIYATSVESLLERMKNTNA